MPATLVLELMTQYRGSHALRCTVECGSFSCPSAGNMPAFNDVPLVNAATTCDAEGSRLYLSVVNCQVDEAMQIRLAGVDTEGEIEMFTVSGQSPLANQ